MTADQGGHGLVIPDAIRTLLQRRAQYMEWLARLDTLGGDFSPDVADRVRADYRVRLTAVEGELHGHREELESSLAAREQQMEELERRHRSCTLELEEIELRHQVGEFDEAEWSDRKRVHDEELAEIASGLAVEREAVAELGAVLLQVANPSRENDTVPVESEAPASVQEVVVDESPEPEPVLEVVPDEPVADPESVTEEPAETVAEVLEDLALEFSESSDAELAEKLGGYAVQSEEETVAPATPTIVESAGGDQFLDELEFLESLSLDDPDSFDAVSRMLEEEDGEAPPEEDGSDRGGAG